MSSSSDIIFGYPTVNDDKEMFGMWTDYDGYSASADAYSMVPLGQSFFGSSSSESNPSLTHSFVDAGNSSSEEEAVERCQVPDQDEGIEANAIAASIPEDDYANLLHWAAANQRDDERQAQELALVNQDMASPILDQQLLYQVPLHGDPSLNGRYTVRSPSHTYLVASPTPAPVMQAETSDIIFGVQTQPLPCMIGWTPVQRQDMGRDREDQMVAGPSTTYAATASTPAPFEEQSNGIGRSPRATAHSLFEFRPLFQDYEVAAEPRVPENRARGNYHQNPNCRRLVRARQQARDRKVSGK
ncbi:uncharacterized protein IL334_002368 [Kwoniella shivajii]|uniref:BZIP domain-containing protein n=1 Tax=Kwoniella shivajii TaxID=564305 RepID=A0ABZ1CUK1_9TREE|nr:hypothetical protein IL334_002368 [Kwoniella shivajii]